MSKSAKHTQDKPAKSKPITLQEVAKVQSRFAKAHDGKVPKGSWVTRLQRVAQRNDDNTSH